MKYFTEKEQVLNKQHFTFRSRQLYLNNFKKFHDVIEYIPLFIQINDITTQDIIDSNKMMFESSKETENLVNQGYSYLPEISCPFLLENLKRKHTLFISKKYDTILCNYPQKIRINEKMNLFFSDKMLLKKNSYTIVSNNANEFGGLGKYYEEIFNSLTKNSSNWLNFMSLTKSEKVILKKLVDGKSNIQISDELFISKYTVITHRKNIYKKLGVNNTMQLVKFSMALNIL